MYESLSQKTVGECINVISDNLECFLQAKAEFDSHIGENKSAAECFNIPTASPSINNMIEQLVDFYEEKLNVFAAAELLFIAEGIDTGLFLDEPAEEFSGKPDKAEVYKAAGYYTTHALVMFNRLLPKLQKGEFEDMENILQLKQAVEYANTASTYISLLEQFADYQPPEQRIKQARNGGKARAEKLYGATKSFVTRRFAEIRERNTNISMSQIAKKLEAELNENPIAGDEPLSNAYDTIYRWVRALNKKEKIT